MQKRIKFVIYVSVSVFIVYTTAQEINLIGWKKDIDERFFIHAKKMLTSEMYIKDRERKIPPIGPRVLINSNEKWIVGLVLKYQYDQSDASVDSKPEFGYFLINIETNEFISGLDYESFKNHLMQRNINIYKLKLTSPNFFYKSKL